MARQTGSSFREVAHVVDVPLPTLEEGQVLLRMTHLGINGGCETFRARGEYACAPRFQTEKQESTCSNTHSTAF